MSGRTVDSTAFRSSAATATPAFEEGASVEFITHNRAPRRGVVEKQGDDARVRVHYVDGENSWTTWVDLKDPEVSMKVLDSEGAKQLHQELSLHEHIMSARSSRNM